MVIHHKHLRMYRKQSELNQADIAFLMQLTDESTVSRWEQGLRIPSNEVFLGYHLLFDVPIETLVEDQKEQVRTTLTERIELLLHELEKTQPSQKVKSRMAFLKAALSRLTSQTI